MVGLAPGHAQGPDPHAGMLLIKGILGPQPACEHPSKLQGVTWARVDRERKRHECCRVLL
jgi:hypothetical protein